MTPLGRISGRIPTQFPGERIATVSTSIPAIAPTITPTPPETAETPVSVQADRPDTAEESAAMSAPLSVEGPHAKRSVAAWPDNKKQDLARLMLATAAKFGSSVVRAPESPPTKDEQQRLEAVRSKCSASSPDLGRVRPLLAGAMSRRRRWLTRLLKRHGGGVDSRTSELRWTGIVFSSCSARRICM